MKMVRYWGVVALAVAAAGTFAKDYTGDIADGAIAFGEISEDSTITVASGVTVTSSTPITGSGKLAVSGGGTLLLSAASPSYSGPIDITSSIVAVAAENALGSGKVTINGTASSLKFVSGSFGKTYENDIEINGVTAKASGDKSTKTIWFDEQPKDSAVIFNGAWTVNGDAAFYAGWAHTDGVRVAEINGAFTATGTVHFNSYNTQKKTCAYYLNGKVVANTLFSIGSSSTYSTPTVYLARSENRIGTLQRDYKGTFVPTAVDAYGGAQLLITTNMRAGTNLNGKDQTISSVQTAVTKQDRSSISSSTPATLTLTGGVASASCSGWLGLANKVSLVMDDKGKAGDFTQTFLADAPGSYNASDAGTTMTMAGTITVKRGNLVFGGVYRLPNVPAVTIEDGSLTMNTTAEGALSGLTSLTVGANGALTVAETAANPFPTDSSLDITLAAGAQLSLPSTVTDLYARYFTWDGHPQKIGSYTHAKIAVLPEGVTLHVANAPEETTEEVTWVGGAGNDTITTAANWADQTGDLDLTGNKYLATFATSGTSATLTGDASFNGLSFTAPNFTIKNPAGSVALLHVYGGGVTFGPGESVESQAIVLEPTLSFKEAAVVNIPVGTTLALTNGLTTTTDVSFVGKGAIALNGPCDFTGNVTVSSNSFSCSGVIGDPQTEDGTLKLNLYENKTFTFTEATLNKPLTVDQRNSSSATLRFEGAKTNVVTRRMTVSNRSYYLSVKSGSTVVFEGGVVGGLKTWFSGGGTTVVRNVPANFGSSETNPLSTNTGGGSLLLQVADNNISHVIPNSHDLNIRTEADWALNGEKGVTVYSLHSKGQLDLATTRQRIRTFRTASAGVLTGEMGSVLELAPTGGVTAVNCVITNAVSLEVGGAADAQLVLTNRAFASAGDLSVTNGTLALAADASWLNGTNFTAKGNGTLRFAGAKQIDRKVARLHFAGSGKVEIPEGVTVRVAEADIGGQAIHGTYAGEQLDGRVTGGGRLQVGPGGLFVIFK